MRTIKKIGNVVLCDIDMWVPGATQLTLSHGAIIFESFGQVGSMMISDIDLASCDPAITGGTDEEIYEQVQDFFSVSHGGSVSVEINGTEVAVSSENISLSLVYDNGDEADFTVDGTTIELQPSGYAPHPLPYPFSLSKTVNGDCGWAFQEGAYSYDMPRGKVGLYELDGAFPLASRLVQDNVHGNKFRFTDLLGADSTPFSKDIVCGDSVTRTATFVVDHLFGIAVGRIEADNRATQMARVYQSETVDGDKVFPVSLNMLQLYYNSGIGIGGWNSHLTRILGNLARYTGDQTLSTVSVWANTNGASAAYNFVNSSTSLELLIFYKV